MLKSNMCYNDLTWHIWELFVRESEDTVCRLRRGGGARPSKTKRLSKLKKGGLQCQRKTATATLRALKPTSGAGKPIGPSDKLQRIIRLYHIPTARSYIDKGKHTSPPDKAICKQYKKKAS